MQRFQRGVSGRRLLALVVVGIALAVTVTATGERAVQATADPGYDWEGGSLQGWSTDWGDGAPMSSTSQVHSGDRSLALPVEGKQYPGFRSPAKPTGLGVGSVVTFHVYAPRNAWLLQVQPYVTDDVFVERFGAKTYLRPGEWNTVIWTVPSAPDLHHLGLEVISQGWDGRVYLDDVSWTAATQLPPVATTGPAREVRSTTVVATGTVDPRGLATTCHFDYGLTKRYSAVTPDVAATAEVSAPLTGLKAGTAYHYRLSCQNSGGRVTGNDVTFTTAAQATDPRGPLFAAQNLVYGSHIGAWELDGGAAISNPVAAANVTAAKIRVIKWQMWKPPCELRPTDCQTEAQFNAAIDGIRSLGAEPLVGLPPIWDQQCTGAPDAWSRAWQDWIIRTAGNRVRLYELGNEPDHYCGMTGQRYYDELWVHAPTLKAYARTLGHEIFIGGPGWSSSEASSLAELKVWLGLAKAGYLAHAQNRDWLPDFISTHTYLITPTENDTQAHAQARIDAWGTFYADLQAYVDATFAGLTDQGYPIADQLKLADSEWNDTIELSWPGNENQAWTDFYVPAMFTMLRGHDIWLANQSTIASHTGQALDLLKIDGTPKPLYNSYRAVSTTDPRNN
ncbi:hypothetical protein [Streptomyces sp. SID13031]|uniref:hypothetical protein n=1 Tax=Streptomyces sp. SID13031 TaxID=2706046 RepID=UPI0013C55142|nr:hypothetical protein [Streptomyces sp. SID13031]NEA34196.1 hypothetical protein [Streptomyces sp. SID13031]